MGAQGASAIGLAGNEAGRLVAVAVIGGTVSELTGGKFANGAASAAFAAAISVGVEATRKPTAQEVAYARLAQDVYENKGVVGYTRVNAGGDDTGLQWALYVDEAGSHVLAFAGTSPTSLANWKANFSQAFGGGSAQYEAGIVLARQYYDRTGGNIHFTGHSLGGGIASAAAIWTGGNATVFNAAGVHVSTLGGYAPSRGSVTYFYSSTDVLRLGNAVTPVSVPGEHISLGAAGLHGMGGVCQVMGC